MKIEIQKLAEVLSKNGWNEISLKEETKCAGLSLICVSNFAALGMAMLDTTGEIASRWADCQEQMLKLRENETVGRRKDLYLAFIVEKGNSEGETHLQSILSDTNVCRKIYIALNGRTVEEAILGIPYLNASTQGGRLNVTGIIPIVDGLGLPSDLNSDLGKRGAAAILDNLLNGKYRKL
jgi:hypothetical protein